MKQIKTQVWTGKLLCWKEKMSLNYDTFATVMRSIEFEVLDRVDITIKELISQAISQD